MDKDEARSLAPAAHAEIDFVSVSIVGSQSLLIHGLMSWRTSCQFSGIDRHSAYISVGSDIQANDLPTRDLGIVVLNL